MAAALDPVNFRYAMVCLHNRNDTYYLPYAVLENSGATDGDSSFFYRIIAKGPLEMNQDFGSFSWMYESFRGSGYTADVYLNVDPESLNIINNYIQRNLLPTEISMSSLRLVIDLVTIMGMPVLLESLRRIARQQTGSDDY